MDYLNIEGKEFKEIEFPKESDLGIFIQEKEIICLEEDGYFTIPKDLTSGQGATYIRCLFSGGWEFNKEGGRGKVLHLSKKDLLIEICIIYLDSKWHIWENNLLDQRITVKSIQKRNTAKELANIPQNEECITCNDVMQIPQVEDMGNYCIGDVEKYCTKITDTCICTENIQSEMANDSLFFEKNKKE